ncbi:cyclin-H-like [Dendronephthya gigantea]|uniref:cyclin-H-like n=1 Tax=Dendronephthya gigantea TaxID=151771 RepID=UPI001069899E|nr:cyclin-H-like [Dendronephthya gigantea]
MFHSSTHKKHWIFSSLEELDQLREKCIHNYATKNAIPATNVVTVDEHKVLCKYYEKVLFHLCLQFQPSLPYSVMFTAFVYFKRIYLQTTVMESLAEDMISVCLYMACKVEEYNVSVDKFIMIYPEVDRERTANIILGNEMGLMRLLNYQLIVHSPKRALEGFFIDIKTRFKQQENFEKCREISNEFLNAVLFSDVVFLYTPSQIALAALFAASKEIVRSYITSVLAPATQGQNLFEKVETIVKLINTKIVCEDTHVEQIKAKLSKLPVPDKNKTKKRKIDNGDNEGHIKRQKSSDSIDDTLTIDIENE